MADKAQALIQLIKVLEPLASEERHRNIDAALTYLGEKTRGAVPASPIHSPLVGDHSGHFPAAIAARMKQHGISEGDAVHVFEFRDGEQFRINAIPGKGKKPQTIAMYHLVGLATYLETGKRDFTDATARQYCKDYGCYDPPNHAAYLDDKHPAFTGDKGSGWSLTIPGLKVAVSLVTEVAEAAAD